MGKVSTTTSLELVKNIKRLKRNLKFAVTAQKALHGSMIKSLELLGGTEEKNILPNEVPS